MITFKRYGDKVRMSVVSDKSDNSFKCSVLGSNFDCERDYRTESINRSKRVINELVRCNGFKSFFTQTLRGDIGSLPDNVVLGYIRRALRDYKRIRPDFRYLLVLERHESGQIHLHGFTNLCVYHNKDLEYRGNYKSKNGRWYSRYVCEFFLNRLGANSFSPIKCGIPALIHYCVKYIMKQDFDDLPCRYLVSRGLSHSECIDLPFNISVFSSLYRRFCEYSYRIFENDFVWVYEMDYYIFEQIINAFIRKKKCLFPIKPAQYALQTCFFDI